MARACQLRTLVLAALLLFMQGCSWTIRFYIVNSGATVRSVTIEVERPSSGFVIFDPAQFSLIPFSDEKPDYERTKRLSRASLKNTVEIPAHTALEIGHLNNDRYENSRQQFINGRIFNLKKIQAGDIEITKANFDNYFKNRNYARVWELP
jgi:hypothetical protein